MNVLKHQACVTKTPLALSYQGHLIVLVMKVLLEMELTVKVSNAIIISTGKRTLISFA